MPTIDEQIFALEQQLAGLYEQRNNQRARFWVVVVLTKEGRSLIIPVIPGQVVTRENFNVSVVNDAVRIQSPRLQFNTRDLQPDGDCWPETGYKLKAFSSQQAAQSWAQETLAQLGPV